MTMIERRPHWDDDLLASVMTHCNDIEQCHSVIAAVEDWQAQRLGSCVPQLAAWQYEKQTIPLWHWAQAEAAIQRVRDVCESRNAEVDDMDPFYRQVVLVSVDEVRRALDGGAA